MADSYLYIYPFMGLTYLCLLSIQHSFLFFFD